MPKQTRTIPLPELGGMYSISVSEDGSVEVFSGYRNKPMRPVICDGGLRIRLTWMDKTSMVYSLRRLVAVTFLGLDYDSKDRVMCIDGDPMNIHPGNFKMIDAAAAGIEGRNREMTFDDHLARQKLLERSDRYRRSTETPSAREKSIVRHMDSGPVYSYESVRELLNETGLKRRTFNRIMSAGGRFKESTIKYT